MAEDIAAGKALSNAPLPAWVLQGPVAERGDVHQPEGSWSASANAFVARKALPVYERQRFPAALAGTAQADPRKAGKTLHEDDAVRI